MDLKSTTLELAKLYGIKPSRSKGQNFLIDESVYQKIISAARIKKDAVILEVGPGLGFLTEELAKLARKVIAVELDDQLFNLLQTKLTAKKIINVELVNQDILRYQVKEKDYSIVANLPYNISAIFLRTFLSLKNPPRSMVLLLQKEVAERLVAKAPKMSLLSIAVQFYGDPEIIALAPPAAFWPEPKVESAIVRIVLRKEAYLPDNMIRPFFRLARVGFAAKRKMLKNNLAGGLKMEAETVQKLLLDAGLKITTRAQELSLEEWLNLFAKFFPFMV